jgi:hypothetical protein
VRRGNQYGVNWWRTHTWQWFALAALLGVIALAVLHGTAHHVLEVVAVFVLVGAMIRAAGLGARDNPVSAGMLRRNTGVSVWASWMAGESRGKRSGRRPRDR